VLVGLLIFLQFLDGYFTYLGLCAHGIAIEANPIIVYFIDIFGYFWGLVLPKAIGILLIIFIYDAIRTTLTPRIYHVVLLTILNMFYIWAVSDWFNALVSMGLLL
jgi:hypothetical protein